MKTLNEIITILRKEFPILHKKNNVHSLGVFGSYVRNEQNSKSDLDILISFTEVPSLIEFIHIENYLSDILGVKVDLVMDTSLKDEISKKIMKEVISV